jgi:hypothetical protein
LARRGATDLIESHAKGTGFVGLYLRTSCATSDDRQVLVDPELEHYRLSGKEPGTAYGNGITSG